MKLTTEQKDQIFNLIETIKPADKDVTFRLVDWPFSRCLVVSLVKILNLKAERKKIDHIYEQWTIWMDRSGEKAIKKIIGIIRRAGESYESEATARNEFTKDLILDLIRRYNFKPSPEDILVMIPKGSPNKSKPRTS